MPLTFITYTIKSVNLPVVEQRPAKASQESWWQQPLPLEVQTLRTVTVLPLLEPDQTTPTMTIKLLNG